MADVTISPNMNLPVPTPGVDTGPDWANNLNACLSAIDGHNHSSGSGVQINPSGLNINADLTFNSINNLIQARSVRFQPQNSPISGASDLGCLYESGVDLYYNDGSGNQVRITSGGSVNATSSGIASGTATASFVSSVLVVNSATNTPANIQGASLLLGNNVASSNYLTLSPPSSMPSSYGLVLPSIPGSTSFLTLDTSGNITGSVSTTNGITYSMLSTQVQGLIAGTAPTVQTFTSGTGTYTAPTSPSPLYIRVRIVGGGGGGGGASANGTGGGTTTFGTSLLTANGGSGGVSNSDGGAGGTATVSSPAIQLVAATGGTGSAASGGIGASNVQACSGPGAASPFGGAGAGTTHGNGTAAAANTGSGGGGAGQTGGTGGDASGSGGAGGYIEAQISSPSPTYAYAIGASGSGGGGSPAGGAGGSGYIIVEEFYQ